MKLTQTRIEIGLEKPFRVLHISDNHLCLADGRDDERKIRLAESRYRHFGSEMPQKYLAEQLEYAKKNDLPVLHTGDMCDFVSYQNLEYAQAALSDVNYFMAAGNHEFSLYVGEAFEDVPYKMRSFDLVQKHFRNGLHHAARVIGGVNFVALDNGYYLFDAQQLEFLKSEVQKGLPVVLMMHNPLYTDELYRFVREDRGQPCGYVCGAPEAMMADYPEDRLRQQRADAETKAFIDYVKREPAIRAILAGHLHAEWEGPLDSGLMQYVAGGGFEGEAREIEFY